MEYLLYRDFRQLYISPQLPANLKIDGGAMGVALPPGQTPSKSEAQSVQAGAWYFR